jgi:hypothetical protein
MDYCGNQNFVRFQSVNDAIVVCEDFSNLFVIKLRDFAPRERKVRELLRLMHNTSDHVLA